MLYEPAYCCFSWAIGVAGLRVSLVVEGHTVRCRRGHLLHIVHMCRPQKQTGDLVADACFGWMLLCHISNSRKTLVGRSSCNRILLTRIASKSATVEFSVLLYFLRIDSFSMNYCSSREQETTQLILDFHAAGIKHQPKPYDTNIYWILFRTYSIQITQFQRFQHLSKKVTLSKEAFASQRC